MNTILDDIAAVIGFSATLRLVAWWGDGVSNLYVPGEVDASQVLPKIIGMAAARQLSKEWGGKHLAIPRLGGYEVEMRKRAISRMLEKGFTRREVAGQLRMSERRVGQVEVELRASGLLQAAPPPDVGPGEPPDAPGPRHAVVTAHVHAMVAQQPRSGRPTLVLHKTKPDVRLNRKRK